ncbi:MAG: allantoicase [Streptosporangiaceae bacterium]
MSFQDLPDLAVRTVGGSVIAANDETFAERENLIKAGPAGYSCATFGNKGQVYDGWETRRRRTEGHDWAVIRLGMPGEIRGVVIDTAHFKGNYPPFATVEACAAEGHPGPAELTGWVEIVPRSGLNGDGENPFPVEVPGRFTHVRLNIFPDGGVARLRVHGSPVADPRLLTAGLPVDLAALENGAVVDGCSNMFYSSPSNLIAPGQAEVMGAGWETARRRDTANDWVTVRLCAPGTVRIAELDTTHFVGNAPGWATLGGEVEGAWVPLLARTALQPDTRHRFVLPSGPKVARVRLDVFPDGGMARLRLYGKLSKPGRRLLIDRFEALTGTS